MNTARPASGALLFARYAYPPNELGYCGPDDPRALLEHASLGADDPELRMLARGFDGAWPYLEVIAGANGIPDPLDRRVVEAYWLGNALLAQVPPVALGGVVEDRFRRVAGTRWQAVAEALASAPLPHHGFHVFQVCPWTGLLRAGAARPALHVLDRCRIRWGTVEAVDGDHAVVTSAPLRLDERGVTLGPAIAETVRLGRAGYRLGRACAPGDVVAMHWDWVCDVVTPAQLASLRRLTRRQLDLLNVTAARTYAARS